MAPKVILVLLTFSACATTSELQPVNLEPCDAQRRSLSDAIANQYGTCQADEDCQQVVPEIAGRCDSFALVTLPASVTTPVTDACYPAFQKALDCPSMAAKCVENRCVAGSRIDGEVPVITGSSPLPPGLTRPEFEDHHRCASDALGRSMTSWTINYTVSAHGQLNYFKLISGPAADAEMVMRKLAQCHMKPATYDGKPVDVRYQMKVVVDIGMSVTP